MRVKDEQQWSMQCVVFDQGETGKQFRKYLTFWVDTAERIMDESVEPMTPHVALSEALAVTEENIGNMDAAAFLGQMLAFIISNWVHGEELAHAMSNIELKIVADAVQDHTAQMQAMAGESVESSAP